MHRPGPPTLMIAIGVPHAGEPDGDEDHLDREHGDDGGRGEGFGKSPADVRINNLVRALHNGGPAAARVIKLYATSLIHLVDSFLDRDRHGMQEAAEEATDHLHEIVQMTKGDYSR